MAEFAYESFAGFKLVVTCIGPHDEGNIISSQYTHDGYTIFTTETGEHMFYHLGDKAPKQLEDGSWEFLGDWPRKAVVSPR